jgi:starvation-inducible outer membrane lipoprotein
MTRAILALSFLLTACAPLPKGCEPGSQAMRDYPAMCDELRER